MLKKLDWVHPRMEELGMLLSDPAVAQDQEKWRALMREHSQLEPLDQAVSRYAALEEEKKQAQMLLDEPDMEQMAREELNQVERQLEQTEREIQQTMDEVFRDKTVIVIAHRFTSIRSADYIYCMADSGIAGQGTMRELMAHDSMLRRMAEAQGGAAGE